MFLCRRTDIAALSDTLYVPVKRAYLSCVTHSIPVLIVASNNILLSSTAAIQWISHDIPIQLSWSLSRNTRPGDYSNTTALGFMHTHLLYMDESFCALTPPVLPYHFKLTCILIIDKRLFTLFHAFLQLWRTALLVFLRAFYKKALFITFHC